MYHDRFRTPVELQSEKVTTMSFLGYLIQAKRVLFLSAIRKVFWFALPVLMFLLAGCLIV